MHPPLSFIPPVIAHRGASAYAPENTLAAFMKAVQLDIKWIEFDVMLAACGTPIIFHDDHLQRTTNGRGEVSQFPYAYLQTLDAGTWFNHQFAGERIPTLAQLIHFFQSTHLKANIEIKSNPTNERQLVEAIWQQQFYFQHASPFLFSSFSVNSLEILREFSADCLMGLLLHDWEPDWLAISQKLNCVSIHINQEIITAHAVKQIKALDKAVLCYTVNDPNRANELYSWGVDAVFSDVPDKILAALK